MVRGNHDHSIGFDEDPRCSTRFQAMAEATRRFTDSVLSFGDKHFLRSLPLQVEFRRGNTRFYVCHALPSDPLFGYCEAESSRWLTEVESVSADVVLVGHTHVPALCTIRQTLVVNPGSLGQPKTGSGEARYAVWEDGRIELKSYPYPIEAAVAKVQALPIDVALRNELRLHIRRWGFVIGAAMRARDDAAYSGEPLRIAFNCRFLLDFLGVMKSGQVEIAVKDNQSAADLRPADLDQYRWRYVVMPMRL